MQRASAVRWANQGGAAEKGDLSGLMWPTLALPTGDTLEEEMPQNEDISVSGQPVVTWGRWK